VSSTPAAKSVTASSSMTAAPTTAAPVSKCSRGHHR
jgi:hypothetical protein